MGNCLIPVGDDEDDDDDDGDDQSSAFSGWTGPGLFSFFHKFNRVAPLLQLDHHDFCESESQSGSLPSRLREIVIDGNNMRSSAISVLTMEETIYRLGIPNTNDYTSGRSPHHRPLIPDNSSKRHVDDDTNEMTETVIDHREDEKERSFPVPVESPPNTTIMTSSSSSKERPSSSLEQHQLDTHIEDIPSSTMESNLSPQEVQDIPEKSQEYRIPLTTN